MIFVSEVRKLSELTLLGGTSNQLVEYDTVGLLPIVPLKRLARETPNPSGTSELSGRDSWQVDHATAGI